MYVLAFVEKTTYGMFSGQIICDDVEIKSIGLSVVIKYFDIAEDEYKTKVLSLKNSEFCINKVNK